jgi:hypothetical protein
MGKNPYYYGHMEKGKKIFEKAILMAEHNEKMKKYLNFILGKFGEQAHKEPPI